MSHLSEKAVSIPRPLRTRDLILSILDRQALPISTRELSVKLRQLGPMPTPQDLQRNLDNLLELGHIRREHDPNTGPHWLRVHGHKVPKHKPRAETLKIQRWALDTLRHGPATAALLAAGARHAGLIPSVEQPGLLIANCLQPLVKRGDLEKTPIRHPGGAVLQYRLPE